MLRDVTKKAKEAYLDSKEVAPLLRAVARVTEDAVEEAEVAEASSSSVPAASSATRATSLRKWSNFFGVKVSLFGFLSNVSERVELPQESPCGLGAPYL